MCCAHFNSHPVTTSTELQPTPQHKPVSATHARPAIAHACAPPTAIQFGTVIQNAVHATSSAFRENQQHGAIHMVQSIWCDPYGAYPYGATHSVLNHLQTTVQIPRLVANYQRSQVLRTRTLQDLSYSIVMFAAAWLWAFRRTPPGTLKESPFLWELRLTPV